MAKKLFLKMMIAFSVGLGGVLTIPIVLAESTNILEEIVVTARKRQENLQDVGLSMSALSRTELENLFARDIQDLASMSPNLIVDDTAQGPGGVAAIYIRGVGVADVEKNFDPAVGVVLDGVFIGANAGSLLRSFDLERVEVLRGPQGTLFGRNTIGGLINIERSKPTGEFGGKFRIGVGDYETQYMDGIVNFGITDNLAAKLSVAVRDQQEGYYKNLSTSKDSGQNDYQSYGVNLLFDANEDLQFEYTYQKEETDQDTPPLLNTGQSHHLFCTAFGYCSPSADKPITGDRLTVTQHGQRPPTPPAGVAINASLPGDAIDIPLDASFDAETHIVEARWTVSDNLQLDYIFGSWETEETIISDWDGTPEFLFHTSRPADYEQRSHEIRLTYDNQEAFNFVVGAYFWESEYEIPLRSWVGFVVPGVILDLFQNTKQKTDSTAFFFEGDYAFNDAWTMTLGGRYTKDEKESQQSGVINTGPNHPDETWSEFTPKLGLRYRFNEDVMFFATYSEGYRSGGFNGRVNSLEEARQPYDPETIDNFEVGFKSEWLGNRLRLNGTIFIMDYQDKQEELQLPSDTGTGQKTIVINTAEATLQGIELELQAYVTDGLSVRANIGLLDSEYDKFSFVDGISGEIVDFSNLDFRRAPKLTGSLDATYRWQVGNGTAWVRGAYHFLGDHYVNFSNVAELENDDQHLLDASINYAVNGFQFSLYGRNLSDEDGYSHGYDVAGLWSYASTRAPRTWGLEVSYDLGY